MHILVVVQVKLHFSRSTISYSLGVFVRFLCFDVVYIFVILKGHNVRSETALII